MRRILAASALALSVLAPASLEAQAFQPAKLPASGMDSLEIVYQGQALGYATFSYARDGDNYRITSYANLAAMMVSQRDSVVFNATTLAPISFTTRGSIQGMAMTTDVVVVDGRAKGTAVKPSPNGPQTSNVDLAVPAGVLADGAELVLLPTLDLTEGMAVTFKSVDASENKVQETVLTVMGKESITVPARTFEAFRVVIKTSDSVTAYVSTAAPKRILLIRLEGQGLEMRLIK